MAEVTHGRGYVYSIPTIVKTLKGVSARLLFKEFPCLKKNYGAVIFGILLTLSQRLASIQKHKFGNTFVINK